MVFNYAMPQTRVDHEYKVYYSPACAVVNFKTLTIIRVHVSQFENTCFFVKKKTI